jgi:hypothetical protein
MTPRRGSESGAIVALASALGHFLVECARRISGSDFVIRHRTGQRPRFYGSLPASKRGAIEGFFMRDLGAGRPVTVWGNWGGGTLRKGRALRLRFTGPLESGERQRVRNFLIQLLR